MSQQPSKLLHHNPANARLRPKPNVAILKSNHPHLSTCNTLKTAWHPSPPRPPPPSPNPNPASNSLRPLKLLPPVPKSSPGPSPLPNTPTSPLRTSATRATITPPQLPTISINALASFAGRSWAGGVRTMIHLRSIGGEWSVGGEWRSVGCMWMRRRMGRRRGKLGEWSI